ncbi:MAG TPA: sulfatase-like hydrolase/transferase, partial [Allosphingosinicella sp.]
AGETLVFFATLLACQGLLFYGLYRLFRRLYGRRAGNALFHVDFLCLAAGGGAALLIAKYQALSYFSDALSFQVVRNLGGGSLVQALLYSASEVGLVMVTIGGAAAAYLGLRLLLRRRWRELAPLPDRTRLGCRQLAGAILAVPLILYAANRMEDVRSGLSRFNSVYLISLLLNEATDFDRDGYGFYSWPTDGHPFDGSSHPYALDVPNNGIDEDGYAGDLVMGEAAPHPRAPVRIAGERPHVILVVLESTRGDALGRRVSGIPVVPNLDALAAEGTSVPGAYSHVGFTRDSMQTLFTGRLAPDGPRGSLFREFGANGYRTSVFSGQAEDFGGIADTVGMHDADIYVDASVLRDERAYSLGSVSSLSLDGRLLLREFERRLGRPEAWRRPNFVYFNLQAAHFPYSFDGMERILPGTAISRREIGPSNKGRVETTYWNAVAYNDRLLGRIVQRLRQLGVWERSLLIVTGDHGESLFDDGFLGHGHMINRQQTHIPFVINRRLPVPGPVGLADMRAIILRAAGADVPADAAATPGRVFQFIGTLERPSS